MGNIRIQKPFVYAPTAADLAGAETLSLVLPDGTRVTTNTPLMPMDDDSEDADDVNDMADTEPITVTLNELPVCTYRTLQHKVSLVISAVGTSYEHSAAHVPAYPVLEIVPPISIASHSRSRTYASSYIAIADFWGVVYALFTAYHTQENIPILLSSSIENHAQLRGYVLRSGLGRIAPSADASKEELFLSRAAFWQGAGTHGFHSRGWLPPDTESTINAYAPFPSVQSFTRTPLVIASHPLRPPKPKQGDVVYRRYCPTVKQTLELTYFDLGEEGSVSKHLQAFHDWHNSDRVNQWWSEAGPMEKHREYVQGLLEDPAVMPLIMSWDGELMGYTEIVWVKENHVAAYIPDGAKDWDRGAHILVGEEKFRGSVRAQAWFRSLHHYSFLADPRTERLIGEPRADNGAMAKVSLDTTMHVQTIFDFPYKRSIMTWLPRERFFKLDVL
ncbi:acyl-CoA N-acyltransferase [Hygrophoropsis aurantiaca]|uniref:Acyl-CoA N-acyltransferase n=1 Tax=Hygrophoropsis aurantiaca TaxID=72124 RepID=A0ACB8AAP5_9AGAM|nr:acyl-CoA N-acyltransferase [Hygrophoropsis aurantiaca]